MQELAREFVPVAEDSERMERESAFFRKFVSQGHFATGAGPQGIWQGTYVVAPDGELLSSSVTQDPRAVEKLIREGLEKWKVRENKPVAEREEQSKTVLAKQSLYPKDGLVLRVFGREMLAGKGGKPEPKPGWWNLDFAWYRKEEAARLVPEKREVGASVDATPFLMRLARFNFLDTVRGFQVGMHYGQEPTYWENEIDKIRLTSRIDKVEGALVHLVLEGETHAVTHHIRPDRGLETRIAGRATYDTGSGRFTAFELGALGTRWGPTGIGWMNDRKKDPGRSPIGFWLEPAADTPAEHLPPVFVSQYGWK